jgi:hypothetical protein
MDKKVLIGIIAGAVVVAVILFFVFSGGDDDIKTSSESQEASSQVAPNAQGIIELSKEEVNDCVETSADTDERKLCLSEKVHAYEEVCVWACAEWGECNDWWQSREFCTISRYCDESQRPELKKGCGDSTESDGVVITRDQIRQEDDPETNQETSTEPDSTETTPPPSTGDDACGDGTCDASTENVLTCWADCKPEFNSDFIASKNSPKTCSGKSTDPDCCSSNSEFTQYDAYYTCDFMNGCENDFSFCKQKCGDAGYDDSTATVVGYQFDLETGQTTSSKTFVQCSCKDC